MKLAPQIALAIALACTSNSAFSQEIAKIDFARDVQPLFRAHCIDCHGPQEQKNGFRLDRRREALQGGTANMIGPGNSVASHLYLKLIGNQSGPRMPPDAPLQAEEINIIKAWIDQGAKWPDELAGEKPPAPSNPVATRMMEELRVGDQLAFQTLLREAPAIAQLQGPGGSTPLMHAVLYGDVESVRLLLERGADPNLRNEAGATALMWAASDLEKTRLLLKHGADANARSQDSRTPLLIATGHHGSSAVVKLLLDHGANPSALSPTYRGPMTPLREAADVGDAAVLQMLIERGADLKSAGPFPLIAALNAKDAPCVDLLLQSADPNTLNMALLLASPPFGSAEALGDEPMMKTLLEHGANASATDPAGRTLLMLAANSDTAPVETIHKLLERGADVNAQAPSGETALDFARRRGRTPIVDLLVKAGAKEGSAPPRQVSLPKPAGSVRAALERSLPLLQRADVAFLQKSGCVSCHHNSLTAMTIAKARASGLPVNDQIASQQRKTTATYVDGWRERVLQGLGVPGDSNTVNYLLVGLAAEKHPPDPATDALAFYLKGEQAPDGRWRLLAHRPPLNSSEFEITAVALRALQVYGPKAQRAEFEQAVELAADWLAKTRPTSTADRAFQLLGLEWAGRSRERSSNAADQLLSEQRLDGGWAQLPSLASDAYATGQALAALHEAGALAATDPAYQRGIEFLLSTQLEDGSWYVASRSLPLQPYFESGFPHGPDQWISAAATNWAALALVPAAK